MNNLWEKNLISYLSQVNKKDCVLLRSFVWRGKPLRATPAGESILEPFPLEHDGCPWSALDLALKDLFPDSPRNPNSCTMPLQNSALAFYANPWKSIMIFSDLADISTIVSEVVPAMRSETLIEELQLDSIHR